MQRFNPFQDCSESPHIVASHPIIRYYFFRYARDKERSDNGRGLASNRQSVKDKASNDDYWSKNAFCHLHFSGSV